MDHSLEWITELMAGHSRLEARNVLRMAQAMATIFDGSSWSAMQRDLINQQNDAS